MGKWLQISVCILAAGCINTSVQRLDPVARPALSPDAVTVLLKRPQQPHTVIAVLESTAETVFDSYADLRKEMVSEAAKLGGQALIFGPERTHSEFIFTGLAMIRSDRKRLTGEVIVYEAGERCLLEADGHWPT